MSAQAPRSRAFAPAAGRTALALGFVLASLWWVAPSSQAEAGVDLVSDTGTALFTTDVPLVVGTTVESCLVVAAIGASATDEVYVGARAVSGALARSLSVTVQTGTGGGGGSCTGFSGTTIYTGTLPALADTLTTGEGVASAWFPASTAARSFRIAVTLLEGAPQNKTAAGRFTWRLAPSTSVTPPTPTPTPPTPTPPTPTPPTPTPPTPTPTPTPPTPTPTTAPSTEHSTEPSTEHSTEPSTEHSTEPAIVVTDEPRPTSSPEPTTAPDPFASPSPGSSPGTGALPGGGPSPGTGGSHGKGADGSSSGPDLVIKAKDLHAKVDRAVEHAVTDLLGHVIDEETAQAAGRTVAGVVSSPQYPVLAIGFAVLFLALQNRFDRRDPKLALAARSARETQQTFPDLFPPTREALP
jgi:hypothetical protein